MDLLSPFGLTLALCGCALIGLPFLDPKDNRTRTALLAICIVLTWRYIFWRFTDTFLFNDDRKFKPRSLD